jgi:GT2 family glycosyltransferase/SAM-dependent methyltransferase
MNEINGRDDQRLIDWTGERCVPWSDDLQVVYEHYHRYALAARFVRDKRVLDLACGEGYGSALLATEASEVVGVDLDETTVEHATRHYGGGNVRFESGSITDTSLLYGEKFDVVVCFEAIEHVSDHVAVLDLVRSRLNHGGLFIVSTPDTAIYQHEHGNDNPFHVKELSKPEFESLLEDAFRHVALLKQNIAVGSVMAPADPGDPDTAVDGVKLQTLRQADSGDWQIGQGIPHTYLLGFASNRQIPKLPAAAVLVDADLKLVRRSTAGDPGVVEQRDAAVADVARLNELYQRSRAEAEELKGTIERLETLRGREEQRADSAVQDQARLRAEWDRLGLELRHAQQARERDEARIEWLRGTVTALESRVSGAEQRAEELLAENADLAAQNSALVQRAVNKYRNVVERVAPRGTTRRDVYELALGRQPGVAEPSPAPLETGPVSVPRSDEPVVSVIVPVHGKWPYTRQCLRFLGGHMVSVPFEVIVVDDASPDDSAARLAECEGVRLVRAERNLGFIGACNLGAQHARGEHLFFLNNDAEVTQSWLDFLMAAMESDDRIGLVGAKLVYPDGRLQECGGIVWSDGHGWNLGRDGEANAAEYNVMRDVDYCSGAAILVRAEVFHQVGGFDSRYAPAYYEDTDLAFAVRAAGYRTVVQPKAVVVHHEGVSHGTDLNAGVKKHQELNRLAFHEKWADTLSAEHLPEAGPRNLWLARHRGTHGHFGPLVLVKDYQVPRPDFDSGSVRIFRVMRQLTELGCRVVFFPGNHARLEPYTTDLQQIGVTVLPAPELQQAFLAEAGSEITLALLSRPQIAWSLVEELRTAAPQCSIAYDTVDVHFLRLERQAALAEAERRAEEAEALRRKAFASRQMEVGLVRSCDVTLVVSEAEQALLRELVPEGDVRVLSNVHEVERHCAQPEGRSDVLFVGSFDHPPNADAVSWAAREIMPLVRERCPDAVLHVVGSNPTEDVLRLAGDGIEVHGWVQDLGPLYARSRVTLAPLRFGAGVKGKVGESLGAGVPVVGTTVAVEGMHLKADEDVLVADDASGLAGAVVRLLSDDDAWRALSAAGKAGVAAQFGPAVSREALAGLLRTADPDDQDELSA